MYIMNNNKHLRVMYFILFKLLHIMIFYRSVSNSFRKNSEPITIIVVYIQYTISSIFLSNFIHISSFVQSLSNLPISKLFIILSISCTDGTNICVYKRSTTFYVFTYTNLETFPVVVHNYISDDVNKNSFRFRVCLIVLRNRYYFLIIQFISVFRFLSIFTDLKNSHHSYSVYKFIFL